MKADCIFPGSLLEVASKDVFAHGIRIWGMFARPVHPASPIFAHAIRVTPSRAMRHANGEGGDAQTAFASSPLLYDPPLFATPSYWRVHPDRNTNTIPTTPMY